MSLVGGAWELSQHGEKKGDSSMSILAAEKDPPVPPAGGVTRPEGAPTPFPHQRLHPCTPLEFQTPVGVGSHFPAGAGLSASREL